MTTTAETITEAQITQLFDDDDINHATWCNALRGLQAIKPIADRLLSGALARCVEVWNARHGGES